MFAYLKLARELTGVCLIAGLLAACSTIDTAPAVSIDRSAKWVVLPFSNATETPLAGQRAEAVAAGLVQSMGVKAIQRYPQNLQDENLFEPGQGGRNPDQALEWAKSVEAKYALTGTVQEWRYKVGVDGEPAVGVTLQVVDLADGHVVWSGVGAKSGWSREALAAVAQKLMRSMLAPAFKAP
jgi:polysaccharide biosynthesis protein PelC